MKNLIQKLTDKNTETFNQFTKDLNNCLTTNEVLSKWFYTALIPTSSQNKTWKDLETLKQYLIKRKQISLIKELNKEVNKIETIFDTTNVIKDIQVVIEWKKSTWGKNPKAQITVNFENGIRNSFVSGSIGGCGYDKECTSIAECFNQCNELLRILYNVKEQNIDTNLHELLGYGSGYGLLPYFEGGVGFSCLERILEKFGYKTSEIVSTNNVTAYSIVKQ
jgi:hypothetical protein